MNRWSWPVWAAVVAGLVTSCALPPAVRAAHGAITVTTVGPSGAMAAVHQDPSGVVVDVAFQRAPDRAAVSRAVPGATVTWTDMTHAVITWTATAPPAWFDLPADLPASGGAHLAAPVHLQIRPFPDVGTLRRVTVPAVAASAAVLAFSVASPGSQASVQAHIASITQLAPTGWMLASDGLTGSPDSTEVSLARRAGRAVWPVIQNDWGTASVLASALADAVRRAQLAVAVSDAAAAGGYPGVHLDIEGLPPSSKNSFTAFATATALALHARGVKLAVDVVPPWGGHVLSVAAPYDIPALAAAADEVIFMTYDEYGGATAGPVAGVDWDIESLDDGLVGVDRGRVWLGVPLYARTWAGGPPTADGYAASVASALAAPGAVVDYDFAAATPFIRSASSVTYFDDADSIARKTALVNAWGLAGIAAWRLGFEDPSFWDDARPPVD